LATVAGIVAQSGGEIAVESTLGRGTTFRLQLPAAQATDVAAPTPVRTATPWPREPSPDHIPVRARILVVEDQDAVRHMTARMLAADGFEVAQARSADEALRILGDGQPLVLVLSDVEMPGAGGRTLAGFLERDARRIPILFMSGYTNDSLLLRGALPPNASFLAKPFTQETLRSAVRKALGE
jgi:CheY-like chemotaxis protein